MTIDVVPDEEARPFPRPTAAPRFMPSPQALAAHLLAGGSPFDFVPLPDWFSYSSFDMFERCPRQYALRYLCRLETELSSPAAAFGSVAHAAFEMFTRVRRERAAGGEGPPGRADLGRFFESAWVASPLAAEPDAEVWLQRAGPMLDRFWAEESAGTIETVGEEMRFRLRFPLDWETSVAVTGFVDRVDRLASGAVELIDYKTGGASSAAEVESSLQLSIYALACRDALQLGRPEKVTLNFVEHGLRFSARRTDAELDAIRLTLATRAREIRGSDFEPTPCRRACGWCDFTGVCPLTAT